MNILLAVLIPIIGALILSFTKKLKGYISILVSILSFFTVLSVYPEISNGQSIEFCIKMFFDMHIFVDKLNFIILSFVSFLNILIVTYSIKYIKKDHLRYYPLLLLTMGFTLGSFLSGDLLTFYIFFEMTTLFSFFLVMYKGTGKARRAGFMYLIMCFMGGALILISLGSVYIQKGNFEICNLNNSASFLFILGCLIKAGAFPLHFWLPEAHPIAPSPVSALLSGIMIKIGIYGIIRFFMTHESIYLVVIIAVSSMLFGVMMALIQSDIKRLLAYSSISQIGYMLLGISISSLGIAGGLFHMINHAVFKSLLFLCMGAVIYSTGERKIQKLGGLYKKMPYTMITCIIASFAISGIPLFNGFVSKTIIFDSLSDTLLKIAFILTGAGTIALFCKLNKYIFFGKLPDNLKSTKEAPKLMLFSMIALAVICIFIGVFPNIIFKNLYAGVFSFWSLSHLLEASVSVILGIFIFVLGKKAGLFDIKEYNIDKIYSKFADFISLFCKSVNKIVSKDLNVYILCILLFLIILFFI